MRAKVIRIGNSWGIRIPRPLLKECGLKGEVTLQACNGSLIIRRPRKPRDGWEASFRKMAKAGDDKLLLGDFPNDWDKTEWTW